MEQFEKWVKKKIRFAEKEMAKATNEIDGNYYNGIRVAFEIVERKLRGDKLLEKD